MSIYQKLKSVTLKILLIIVYIKITILYKTTKVLKKLLLFFQQINKNKKTLLVINKV